MRVAPSKSILLASLATTMAFAGKSGKVLDRAGNPLNGVAVHQVLADLRDTSDAAGLWMLGTPPTRIQESRPGEQDATLRGDVLRVVLPNPGKVSVEAITADGRRTSLLEFMGIAGANERVVSFENVRLGAMVRVVTPKGATILSSLAATPTPRSVLPGARAAAETIDTLVFSKPGFDTKRVILDAVRDTFTVTMDSSLAAPTGLWTLVASADRNSVGWTSVPGATEYVVRRCDAAGTSCADSSLGSTAGFLLGGLSAGRVVRVRVRALQGPRASEWSQELVVHRSPVAPRSRNKVLDTLPPAITPMSVTISVPGWRNLRRVRAYSEITPFQDTVLAPDTTLVLTVGTSRLPVFDSAWIRILAEDSLGDTASCRILVRERSLVVTLPTVDTTIPFESNQYWIYLVATSKVGIAKVLAKGIVVTRSSPTSNSFTALVPVNVGNNSIPVVVTDSAGSEWTATVKVLRRPDTRPPELTPLSPLPDSIPYAKSWEFRFRVRDNDSVRSVDILGNRIIPVAGIYTAVIPLPNQMVEFVVVSADQVGNISRDTIRVRVYLKDRDGNNLPYGRMPDGKLWTLRNVQTLPSASTEPEESPSSCAQASCERFGRLYSWTAAMAVSSDGNQTLVALDDQKPHQGICPAGWHVANLTEWSGLMAEAASSATDSVGLYRLRSAKTDAAWVRSSILGCDVPTITKDFSGLDSFGFRLVPTHTVRTVVGCKEEQESFSAHWSPTQVSGSSASALDIREQALRRTQAKSTLNAVRCVAD